MGKEIILTFDGDEVKKEVKGFTGKSCVSETKFIEEALGESSNRKLKKDYHVTYNPNQQKQNGIKY